MNSILRRVVLFIVSYLIALFFMSDVRAADDSWTTQDSIMQAAVLASLYIDERQTQDIRNHPGMYETNPLLGSHPGNKAVRNYFIGVGIASTVLSVNLPQPYRFGAQAVTLGVEISCTHHNQTLHLRAEW